MRNKYRKLKIKVMIQTLGISLIVGSFGYFILNIFIDGVLQDPFARAVVSAFEKFGLNEENAINMYRLIFWQNKALLVGMLFFGLFVISFYLGMSKFSRYLRRVELGIEMILNESDESIRLPEELEPVEDKLNEIKRTLRQQRQNAEETEQRKNDLVVYLAHDLKTPLTSVIAYLSLLDDSKNMEEEQREKYTAISLEKAKRLGVLINEFFEITKYNLQDITLDKKGFYLYVLLEQVLDSFAPVLEKKNLSCQTDIDDDIFIEGDPDRLARVFENLLRNAVSYSFAYTMITVTAKMEKGEAVISIKNQGNTIAPHQMEKLFEKFYRLDEARSSETGGSGLGLAIAKEIVELHGGRIQAESKDGETTFCVKLPGRKELSQ